MRAVCHKQHASVSKQLPPVRVGQGLTYNLRVKCGCRVEATRQQP